MTIVDGIIGLGMGTNTAAKTIQATTALARGFKILVSKGTTVMGVSSTMAAARALELERLLPQTRLSNALGKVNHKSSACPKLTRAQSTTNPLRPAIPGFSG